MDQFSIEKSLEKLLEDEMLPTMDFRILRKLKDDLAQLRPSDDMCSLERVLWRNFADIVRTYATGTPFRPRKTSSSLNI